MRGLRLVLAASGTAALVGLIAVLVVAVPDGDNQTAAGQEITVRAVAPALFATPPLLERSAEIIRARAETLGIRGVTAAASDAGVVLKLPLSAPRSTDAALLPVAELRIYDYEGMVLAEDPSLYRLVLRASRLPHRLMLTKDTALYLFAQGRGKPLIAGPAVDRESLLAPFGGRVPRRSEIVEVSSDFITLKSVESSERSGGRPPLRQTRWVLLRNEPALSASDVDGASVGSDDARIVNVRFTDRGAKRFAALTGELARRGVRSNRLQSMAIAIDRELVSRPSIDFRTYPVGLDGSSGLRISAAFSQDQARSVAAQLSTGPLPAPLTVLPPRDVSEAHFAVLRGPGKAPSSPPVAVELGRYRVLASETPKGAFVTVGSAGAQSRTFSLSCGKPVGGATLRGCGGVQPPGAESLFVGLVGKSVKEVRVYHHGGAVRNAVVSGGFFFVLGPPARKPGSLGPRPERYEARDARGAVIDVVP